MTNDKSCLFVFECSGVGDKDSEVATSTIIEVAKSVAHTYYVLEDKNIVVNFAR